MVIEESNITTNHLSDASDMEPGAMNFQNSVLSLIKDGKTIPKTKMKNLNLMDRHQIHQIRHIA
jgi:hypothetical protein